MKTITVRDTETGRWAQVTVSDELFDHADQLAPELQKLRTWMTELTRYAGITNK